jgi:ATP-dependent exoDNAse (exonuclease V) beta subunit
VADTIARLLEATRAHAAFAIWPTGTQALANVGRLMDLARRAEQQGLLSFRGFVEKLEDDAERGEVAEAPLLEEGVEGVRIMTVHKAKGLEFPVVILADMTANETVEQPMRWTDPALGLCVQRLAGCTPPELREHGGEELQREREEAVRLLYVAATRPRDALVVPVVGDERRDGWLSAIAPAVYPSPAGARSPESREAPGVPHFREDSVPGRPANVARPRTSVMPGLHQPEAGRHRVVWWDPAVLKLNVRPSIGLSQTRILEADDDGRATLANAHWEKWKGLRRVSVERGERPSRVVRAATDWVRAGGELEGWREVVVTNAGWKGKRPHGLRFGTLMHALLATVALDDDEAAVAAHADLQARMLGATSEDRDAAVSAVVSALALPLMRSAAAAALEGLCRREASLVFRLDDGTLIEAVADLAYRTAEDWTVVDFKTDAGVSAATEVEHKRQVALYARGIAEATGLPARGFLLRV